MSSFKLPIHLLQELEDITESINSPLKSTQRIKYTCLDVSKTLIVFGATSGGIYVFNRQPCEFIQLIPSKDGAITRVAISPDGRHICFANGRGVVTVTECEPNLSAGRKSVTCKEHQGNEVTAISWSGRCTVFTADDVGRVAVTMLPNFLPKNIFQSGSQIIMNLDSRVCQMDCKDYMLLVSTLTRCYICDTAQEQYRQIGQKLRDGEFGACFITKENVGENSLSNDVTDNRSEVKKYNIVNGDEAFAVSDKFKNTFIYCARPSSRLWEANMNGTVESTHQFKQVLTRNASNVVTKESYDNESVNIKEKSDETDGISVIFPKIYSIKNSAIISFKRDSIYILNLANIDDTIWFDHYKDIVECKIYNDLLYIWLQSGSLISLKYMKIDKYILKCYLDGKYTLCANLCALYSDYFLSDDIIFNDKLKILCGLKDKLKDQDLILKINEILVKFENLKNKDINDNRSGIRIVENIHHTQNNISDDEDSFENEYENKPITFKDLSSTMTNKINTSKKILKEKWDGLEEKIKHLSTDMQSSFDENYIKKVNIDSNQPNNNYNLNNAMPSNDNLKCDELNNETSQENEQINDALNYNDDDSESLRICKALYNFHQKNVLNGTKDKELLNTIMKNSVDIKEIYNYMIEFEQYCVSIKALNTSEWIPNDIFLYYISISERRDKLIDDILSDEILYEYFVNSCITVNSRSQKVSNTGCECGYPLPFIKTNVAPEYSDVIDQFIEKQWTNKSTEQCYEVCKKLPYLWRRIIYLRRNEDLQNLLKILLQILDENLLHSFLPQFTMETWEKAIQLYSILQCNECLNCSKKFDHMSVKNTLNWDDIGSLVIKSVGARNALDLMGKYSGMVDLGELTMRFYHSCLLVSLFDKYDGTLRSQLVDTLYACYGSTEAVCEICKLLRDSSNGSLKNTSLPLVVAVQSKHWGLQRMFHTITQNRLSKSNLSIDDADSNSQNTGSNSEKNDLNSLDINLDDNSLILKSQNIKISEALEFLKVESGNTDCNLCGLAYSNDVLIQDGGLWVFKCGHIFHGACLELSKIKLCPSCKL